MIDVRLVAKAEFGPEADSPILMHGSAEQHAPGTGFPVKRTVLSD